MKYDIQNLKDSLTKLEKDLYFGRYDGYLRVALITSVLLFVGISYCIIK